LLLIDSHDLRLTAQQVHELAKGMGLPVPDEDHIQQLLQQTEGWMAGIKMVHRGIPGKAALIFRKK
jgi:ATP/maltotriose-dependent transcriptional regulator MalT